jgi:peptidyl-dipeptidase A
MMGAALNDKEQALQDFITSHVAQVRPLHKEAALASWRAESLGKAEDYAAAEKLSLQIKRIYSDAKTYGWLKELKQAGAVRDPRLARQLVGLHNAYLANQIDPQLMERMVKLSTELVKRFNTFRGTIDGTSVSLNVIKDVLTSSTDSARREKAWRASKQVGPVIAADLVRLVAMRNEAARKLGFPNYHTMDLILSEQDPAEIDRIFTELEQMTNEPFAQAKAELDRTLAARYGIAPDALMPWHYHDPFFQEAPLVQGINLDVYYEKADPVELARRFYGGIGLPVEDILGRSDLFEREGKSPHAFCTDIDREGDVRILCNMKNNHYWMGTILHELGHAAYSKNHDRGEPYLLRDAAHAFATEGIAMFFEKLNGNADWMHAMLNLTDEQRREIQKVSGNYQRLKALVFARWTLVMYNFEKALYANPDQDLNELWWRLVERYQGLKRPKDDRAIIWPSKIHLVTSPVYYHNYMLGELFAAQLHAYVAREVLGRESGKAASLVGEKKLGAYLREQIFAPGSLYRWDEMIRRATGEPLTAKYFAAMIAEPATR